MGVEETTGLKDVKLEIAEAFDGGYLRGIKDATESALRAYFEKMRGDGEHIPLGPETWEDPTFDIELPSFNPGTGEVFKKEWLAVALEAIMEGEEPIWLEGQKPESYSPEVLQDLGRDRKEAIRRKGLPVLKRFALEFFVSDREGYMWDKVRKECKWALPALKTRPSDAVKNLYQAYTLALKIRESGAELCKLATGRDAEIYNKGLARLAEAHGMSFVLSRRAFGTAASMALKGLTQEAGLEEAITSMAEVLNHNPTEEVTTVIKALSGRVAAAVEVESLEESRGNSSARHRQRVG